MLIIRSSVDLLHERLIRAVFCFLFPGKSSILEQKTNREVYIMKQYGEAIFSTLYLIFDLIAAVIFFINANGSSVLFGFGILTLILGGGDAFHLVPRILSAFKIGSFNVEWWSGLGLMVSSITMTVFYVVLYYLWQMIFPEIGYPVILGYIIWITAVLRIILCLFPQNNWFHYAGNPKWGIYRNLPFIFTGLAVAYLFFLSGNTGELGLYQIGIAILISFACYLPVVLFSKKYPAVGMLMIPKTLAYVWIISMGLTLIGKI